MSISRHTFGKGGLASLSDLTSIQEVLRDLGVFDDPTCQRKSQGGLFPPHQL